MTVREKKTVFLYSGEGTHARETQLKLLKCSKLFSEIDHLFTSKLNLDLDLEEVWNREISQHTCPYSPLLTVVTQLCLSDIWCQWGYQPNVVIGHSTGELSAAYQAGLYSLEEILVLAYRIGKTASRLEGHMLHGWLTEKELNELPVNLASKNFIDKDGIHVTLSGKKDEMENFLFQKPNFVKMKMPHPWHHPDYGPYANQLECRESKRIEDAYFVSGVTTRFENHLEKDHWQRWLVKPIDFVQAMQTVKQHYGDCEIDCIEIGFHPVLTHCCEIFEKKTYVSSMHRGEDDIQWIMFQRQKLVQDTLLDKLKYHVHTFRKDLDFDTSLAYQGLTSKNFVELTLKLRPYFPCLAPQDFYRFKTLQQLMKGYGIGKKSEIPVSCIANKNRVVITGMSCRLPSSVETLPQFWEMLVSKTDQVRKEEKRSEDEAGFLNERVSAFDHQYFHIPLAEARTMDPQQILALELVEMLFKDANIDPEKIDRKRFGVYIGVWNQEYHGDTTSVFYPTGINPSIIASRISYHYDLRGPSMVINTACSSSLLAVHYAAKDIEAGRIDYAIAGGVNLLLDQNFSDNMRNSGFLSADNRCKSFDDTANGYVRSEGGGLILLVKEALAAEYYAELLGSSINQNGGRPQVITAPHPVAQEELIVDACKDAGIAPQELAYVECHGTGTKIGDPIEMSAIFNTVAKNRSDICYIGSIKSNIGHLESAAGIAGLQKAVLALHHGIIPPDLHFNTPNQYIDFASNPVQIVCEQTEIDHQATMGISSFGFGGSNAHIIVRGADEESRKSIQILEPPFNRERAAPIDTYLTRSGSKTDISADTSNDETLKEDIPALIQSIFFTLTGIGSIEPDVELMDQGLDSLSATELTNALSKKLNLDIDPEIFFDNPLFEQFSKAIENLIAASNTKADSTRTKEPKKNDKN